MIDPGHPLFGRTYQLAGMACLPDHVRYCQVEILPHRLGYIPVSSTNLVRQSCGERVVLTAEAISQFVVTFHRILSEGRRNDASDRRSRGLGISAKKRAKRHRAGGLADSHGGD